MITPSMWVRTTEDAESLDGNTTVPKDTRIYVVATDDTSDDPDSTGDLFVTAEWNDRLVYLDDTVLEPVQTDEERYIEALQMMIIGFENEDCDECGEGIQAHTISPDMFGLPHAWCAHQPEDTYLLPEAIPEDYEVQPLGPDENPPGRTTCGTCELSWDDDITTSMTPVPSGRCPFEYFHIHEE